MSEESHKEDKGGLGQDCCQASFFSYLPEPALLFRREGAEGRPRFRIVGVNRAFESVFGVDAGSAVGRGANEILVESRLAKILGCLESHGQGGGAKVGFTWMKARYEIQVFDLDAGLQAVILRDVTAQVAREAALLAEKRESDAKNMAKSDFLANMSHEIRTPMNGVVGMAELLLDSHLTQSQLQYVRAICYSADTLLNIINDILDFSKIEAGKLDLRSMPFDLREIVEHLGRSLAARAEQDNVELAVRYPPRTPRMVVGDPVRIGQVLMNLANNAVKFTRQGYVFIDVGLLTVGQGKAVFEFRVIDTGVGIKAEDQKLIFEKFHQAHSADAYCAGGTGLGLSISKRLVEMMGGAIGVESFPDEGSTFFFILPLELDQSCPEEPFTSPAALRGKKILLADSSYISNKIISDYFKAAGVVSHAAASDKLAFEFLAQAAVAGAPFDLALVREEAPGVDAGWLLDQMRGDSRLKDIPVALLTSFSRQPGSDAPGREGFAAAIAKPVFASKLFETLERALVPSAPAVAAPPQQEDRPVVVEPSRTILLAEDNEINVHVLRSMLLKLGFATVCAADGVEAAHTFKPGTFAAVLMDIQMPKRDGYEATKLIRQKEVGHSRTPIIAITAYAMDGDREKCLLSGMDGYVSKPVKIDVLKACLDKHVGMPGRDAP